MGACYGSFLHAVRGAELAVDGCRMQGPRFLFGYHRLLSRAGLHPVQPARLVRPK